MSTTTKVTNVDLDISGLAGTLVEDFDWDAIEHDYADALATACGVESVAILANGDVICDVSDRDAVAALDWSEISDTIDGTAIVRRHEMLP